MKKEHSFSPEGSIIVRLPKLPFGRKNNYNKESEFTREHFL
jgi:hypothetical protein